MAPDHTPSGVPERDAGARAARALTMTWLDNHVPLTLIMDLSMPYGPHSRELLDTEPGSRDTLVAPG